MNLRTIFWRKYKRIKAYMILRTIFWRKYKRITQINYNILEPRTIKSHTNSSFSSALAILSLEVSSHQTVASQTCKEQIVTPQTRGSVDYPSTRGIQVEVGLPDATFRKSGRVSFVRGALPKYNACIKSAFTCPKQSNICNIYPIRPLGPINSIHANYEFNYIPNSSKSSMFYSYTTYIKIREF